MNTITGMFDVDAIVADLVDDGDTYVLTRAVSDLLPPEVQAEAGTWTFRFHVEPDDIQVCDVEDPEVFGRYEYREYGRGDRDRPGGFTGAAVKISSDSDQSTYFWYEPPKDFRQFKGSGFTTIEEWEKAKQANLRHIRNLLSWGYISIGVTVTHVRPDGYKRSWNEWIGGVESAIGLWGQSRADHNAYVATIVSDIISNLISEIEQEEA